MLLIDQCKPFLHHRPIDFCFLHKHVSEGFKVFFLWVLCEAFVTQTLCNICHFIQVIRLIFYLQQLIISALDDTSQYMTFSMYPGSWFLQASFQGHRCWQRPRQVMAACVPPARESKKELSSVRKIFKENNIGRDVPGFLEKQTVISKCFLASSGCLTKAAGEFYWRIRLVAFLWLLMSGGFGLCLESQWSKRLVSFCGAGYWLWLSKQCFFSLFLNRGLFMLWSIILHLWLQCDILHRCHHVGSTAEECTWGFPWAHGRKLTCFFNILKSHQQNFSIYHPTGFIRIGPQIF